MPRTIYFEGRTIQVPDDFSDEEIRGILSQGAPPMQAANAKPVDPRFFAPMPPVHARPTSSSNRVDPRFFTTMDTSVAGEATDSGNVGQNPSASTLGMSLFYAAQQDPGQYARLLHLQDLTGIPPIVSAGNETEIQQWVDANRIDPHYFTTIAPNTAVWAGDPDNAAVSGVDEILRLGRIEQNAAAMRAVPSLNTFLNRYGSAAIPTSADDLQVQAWRRVASFWQAMGKGSPKPVDSLVAVANQALAQQHAGDSAYRLTPRPEPSTIAEEAQQATTPRTFQVYTPTSPTIAPLPTPAEAAAPGVRYQTDAWGLLRNPFQRVDPALRADMERQTTAVAAMREAEFDAFLDKLPRLIPKDPPSSARPTVTEEEKTRAEQLMAEVRSGQRSPWAGFSPEDQELVMRYGLSQGGGVSDQVDPAVAAVDQAIWDKLSDMSRVDQLALMILLPEEGITGQIAKLFFAANMARSVYQSVPPAWEAYQSGDNAKAAYITTGALIDLGMLGMMAHHAASGVKGGLGDEQLASEGLGEGAREAMGGSSATEPVAGTPSARNTFSDNLSHATEETADSKLRGRSPKRFYQALQAIFQGHESLQIPVEQFNDYFRGKSMDPAAVAREIGADNYPDVAATPGAKVEVPTEGFLGKLTLEEQRGLLRAVVDPAIGMTLREHQALQRWLTKPPDADAQASAQTVATPEGQTATESSPRPDADSGTGAGETTAANTPDTPVQTVPETTATPERQTATEASPQGEGIRTSVKKKTNKVAGGLVTIGGRKPINSRYAGGMHPAGIRFSEQGFPDFSPRAIAEVRVQGLTGRHLKDFAMANDALGIPSTPKGYTWHHVEDGETMQLVPSGIHRKVKHTGGAAVIRNGGLDKK